MSPPKAEQGFSLVETLVAFAVIAGMSGMLFDAITTNARAAQHIAQKRTAILLARSLLAQAVLPPGSGQLSEAGSSNAFTWRFTERALAVGARDEGAALEEVRIDVLDRSSGRRLASVRTLRLAR